jgi:protein phosphatase
MVDDDVIRDALGAETIDFAATELVRLALEGGGYDNVTVVIAEFVEEGTEPDEHLSSADGQPQLVGAAASQPRPRTGQGSAETSEASSFDPEELRYAPRPPSSRRWVRWTLVGILIAAIVGAAGAFTYHWSQTQYFVASHDGKVTIFKGVDAKVPGIKLKHVEHVTDVVVTSLPEYRRQQVRAGIEASSKADAEQIVANLSQFAVTPTPTPTKPTPSKKKSSKTTNTVWRR